jgi:hypothetical protein
LTFRRSALFLTEEEHLDSASVIESSCEADSFARGQVSS